MKLRCINKGEVVIEEGSQDRTIYMLSEGALEVLKGGQVVAELSDRNSVFGEISSLLRKPRSCSVRAKVDSEIIEIGNDIDHIIDNSPILTRSILLTLASRLAETTNRVQSGGDASITT